MNNLKDNIMNKIHTGQVKQKPVWYFMVSTLGVGLLGLILFFISIFWSSFLLLTLREYSMFAQIGIGLTTLLQNLLFWIFIVCGIGMGVLCYRWLRDHTSLYRYRHMYTGIIVFAIILGIGVSINIVDREAYFINHGRNSIPGFSRFDTTMRPPRPSIITEGKVLFVRDDMLIVQERNRPEPVYVVLPDQLQVTVPIVQNDHILIIGNNERGLIYADDIVVK